MKWKPLEGFEQGSDKKGLMFQRGALVAVTRPVTGESRIDCRGQGDTGRQEVGQGSHAGVR